MPWQIQLMWQSFDKGDKVYVYFPKRKAKQEHHLSSISFRNSIRSLKNALTSLAKSIVEHIRFLHTDIIRPIVKQVLKGKQDIVALSHKQEFGSFKSDWQRETSRWHEIKYQIDQMTTFRSKRFKMSCFRLVFLLKYSSVRDVEDSSEFPIERFWDFYDELDIDFNWS